jgi:hypothetical protein
VGYHFENPKLPINVETKEIVFNLPDGVTLDDCRNAIVEMVRPTHDGMMTAMAYLIALKPLWDMDETSARVHMRSLHEMLSAYPEFVYAEVLAQALDADGKALPARSQLKKWADQKIECLSLFVDYFLTNPSDVSEPFHAE